MEKKSTSTWFALRNPVFSRLWLASVLSGTFVSAQDITATWLMHDLGAWSFALSLMATAAAAPFFLFTLPAGAVADVHLHGYGFCGRTFTDTSSLSQPKLAFARSSSGA